jgi:transposase
MPAQDAATGDQAMGPQRSGQPPHEGREHGLVRPVQASWVGAPKDGDLMPEHEELARRPHRAHPGPHPLPSPIKLTRYTGLCPRVYQSGGEDHRGPLAKNGPKYLHWALIEAATHAARHPVYAERYPFSPAEATGNNVVAAMSGTRLSGVVSGAQAR